jgi:hypothetical protein
MSKERAACVLKATGYSDRVPVLTGDGEHAAPEHAPFDAIFMTAGAWDIPEAWRARTRVDLLCQPVGVIVEALPELAVVAAGLGCEVGPAQVNVGQSVAASGLLAAGGAGVGHHGGGGEQVLAAGDAGPDPGGGGHPLAVSPVDVGTAAGGG